MYRLRRFALLFAVIACPSGHQALGKTPKKQPLPRVVARLGFPHPDPSESSLSLPCFSPDNELAAYAGGTIKIVEVRSEGNNAPAVQVQHFQPAVKIVEVRNGRRRHTVPLPEGTGIAALAFSPDDRMLACVGDETLLIDTATGKVRRRLDTRPLWRLECLAFSRDGKTLALAGDPRGIRLWDTTTGKQVRTFPGNGHLFTRLAFSPDGKLLASAGLDQTVRLWDVAGGKERAAAHTHEDYFHLCFRPDGKTLAAAGGAVFRQWEVPTLRVVSGPATKNDWILGVGASPHGFRLLTSDSTNTIRVRDATTGKVLHELADLPREKEFASTKERLIGHLTLSADGRTLATGRDSGDLWLWELDEGKTPVCVADRPVLFLGFAAQGRELVTVEERGRIRVWDVARARELRHFQAERHPLALSPDATVVASVPGDEHDRAIRLHHVPTGKELCRLRNLRAPVTRAVFSPDNKTVATAGAGEKLIRVWSATTGKQLFSLPIPGDPAVLSPDGRLLAALVDQGLFLAKVRTGTEVLAEGSKGDKDRVSCTSLAFSGDGRTLIGGTSYGVICCWEVSTGKLRCRMETDGEGPIRVLAVSPGGRLLANVADPPGVIRVWDLAAQKTVHRVVEGEYGTTCLAFSPDGRVLAAGRRDCTVLLREVSGTQGPSPPRTPVDRKRLEALGADVFGADAGRAYRAVWALAAAPGQAVPYLRGRLRPAAALDPAHVRRLVKELDDDRFSVRQSAFRALETLGERAEPALREALRSGPTLELRRRVERLLDRLNRRAFGADCVPALRGVEVLERVGSKEAREVLEKLAKGAADAPLTREAEAALRRLDVR